MKRPANEREAFVQIMTAEGMPTVMIRALMKAQATLNRYNEMTCSDEAADRDRLPCPATKGKPCLCDEPDGEHEDVTRISIKADTIQRQVERLLASLKDERGIDVRAVFNGDPRGPAILLKVPSGRTDDWGGRGICVP